MKSLITGADGFVGRWLARELQDAGDDVWLAVGARHDPDEPNARQLDIRDTESVDDVLAWSRPDAVYHLAAVAFGPDARRSVGDAIDTTVTGTTTLLRAAARMTTPPTVLVPSSSEVYGHPVTLPIDEDHPCHPASTYGASKLAQESVALAFDLADALPVVVTRSFNHIGPGQRDVFVVASFASQLARIAVGRGLAVLRVGNLSAERDFTDVRDVVRAYRLLAAGGHRGRPLNVASGTATSIDAILGQLIEISGVQARVEADPKLIRAVDVPRVVGDATAVRELTGWQPEIPLGTTLAEVWADALARAGAAGDGSRN